MAWKYSFGFKLSQTGRERIENYLRSQGVTGDITFGWDSVIIDVRIPSARLPDLMIKFVETVKEEEV